MINMNSAIRRPSNTALNVLLAAGSLTALLAGLMIVDERVRDQLTHIVTGQGPTGEVGIAIARIERLATVALHTIRDQGVAYAPLTIFGLAALVLVFFMTRT